MLGPLGSALGPRETFFGPRGIEIGPLNLALRPRTIIFGPLDIILGPRMLGFGPLDGAFGPLGLRFGRRAAGAAVVLGARLLVPIHYGVTGAEGYEETPQAAAKVEEIARRRDLAVQLAQPGDWIRWNR